MVFDPVRGFVGVDDFVVEDAVEVEGYVVCEEWEGELMGCGRKGRSLDGPWVIAWKRTKIRS